MISGPYKEVFLPLYLSSSGDNFPWKYIYFEDVLAIKLYYKQRYLCTLFHSNASPFLHQTSIGLFACYTVYSLVSESGGKGPAKVDVLHVKVLVNDVEFLGSV